MSVITRNLEYVFTAVDKASSVVKKITGSMGEQEKAIVSMVAKYGSVAYAASKLKDLGMTMLTVTSALENLEKRSKIIFEDSFPYLESSINAVAKATGRSSSDTLELAASIGGLVDSAGIAGREMADMSSTFAKLAIDMASFAGTDAVQAVDALKAALSGAGKGMKEYGIVMNDAEISAFALSKGIKQQTKDMNLAQLMQLRYQFVMEKTAKIQDDAKKNIHSYANQVENFKGQWTDMLESVGQSGGLNLATHAIGLLSDSLRIVTSILHGAAFAVKTWFNAWMNPTSFMTDMIGVKNYAIPWTPKVAAPTGGGGSGSGSAESKEKDEAAKELQNTVDKINELKTKYGEMNTDITISLMDLGKKHKETMQGLRDDLRETQQSMKDLQSEYEKSTLGMQSNMADLVIDQHKRIQDLDKKSTGIDLTSKERSDILVEMKKAKEALAVMDRMFVEQGGTKDQLTEAKRQAGLEANLKQMEEIRNRMVEEKAQFDKKMSQIKDEEDAIKKKMDAEKVSHESHRNELLLTQQKMTSFHDGYIANLTDMSLVTDEMIGGMNQKLDSLNQIIDKINAAQDAISGVQASATERGLLRVPTKAGGGYAGGLTMVGERGPELVRLPGGSHVTDAGQTRRNAGGGGVAINVTAPIIGTVYVTNQADEGRIAAKVEQAFTRMIQMQEFRAA